MIFHRLHHRLIAAIVGLMIIFLSAIILTLRWSIRQNLEKALGDKLQAIAVSLSAQYTSDEIALLMQGAGPRIRPRFLKPITEIQQQADVKRVYFFSMTHESWLDTDTTVSKGDTYYNLLFFQDEMHTLKSGQATHTMLFTGIDNHPTMSGFAPIILADSTIGGIGVDGNAHFLNTVQRFNQRMLTLGGLGMILAIFIAVLLARSVTRPVAGLVQASQQIGSGNYTDPIPSAGSSEIGELSHTMESMRQNVVQREQELKAMIAAVAHEIRNPLGGIELSTGLLFDEIRLNNSALGHLNRIKSEIRYLNDIVHRFLEYAKPETPQPEFCQFSEILDDVKVALMSELTSNKIRLQISGEQSGKRLYADPSHIKRILLNLVQNSIHAMDQGGNIKIDLLKINQKWMMRIEDNGSGIPKEVQHKVFEPFFTTREKGTGLGLAIVKRLVEANGGQIVLFKSDSDGTIFEITLHHHE